MQEFNKNILETMQKEVKQIKSVYEVCKYCKEGNAIANKEYLRDYPTHKDLLNIFESAVSIVENNIIGSYNEYAIENALNDIEFIMGQNVLMESHVQRLLLSVMTLQDFPIYKKKLENVNQRIYNLYNCESSRYNINYDEDKAKSYFNYQQLESYLRYNKVGYEEELIDMPINGDYITESVDYDIDGDIINKINKVAEKYNCLETANIIDRFILEQHGIDSITQVFNNGKLQLIYHKNGTQFNIYRNTKKKNEYYLMTESKSIRLTVKGCDNSEKHI